MRCADKAALKAAARVRAAGGETHQDPAAGASSPAAANKQPATPDVAGARGCPRAASSSAASAAGVSPMDIDPEIEVVYSGESDSPSDSMSPAKSGREAVAAGTTTAKPLGSLDRALHYEMFGSSDESEDSSLGSNRSHLHSCDAGGKHDDIHHRDEVDDSPRSHCSRSNPSDCGDRSAGTAGTTQEELDRNTLRSARENKPWMLSRRNLGQWYG